MNHKDVFIQIRMVGNGDIVDKLLELFPVREDAMWDISMSRFAVLNPSIEGEVLNYIIDIIPKVKSLMNSDFELESVYYEDDTLKRILHVEVGDVHERYFLLPFYTPKQSYLIS